MSSRIPTESHRIPPHLGKVLVVLPSTCHPRCPRNNLLHRGFKHRFCPLPHHPMCVHLVHPLDQRSLHDGGALSTTSPSSPVFHADAGPLHHRSTASRYPSRLKMDDRGSATGGSRQLLCHRYPSRPLSSSTPAWPPGTMSRSWGSRRLHTGHGALLCRYPRHTLWIYRRLVLGRGATMQALVSPLLREITGWGIGGVDCV